MAEHVQGVPEKPAVVVAVPSPVRVRVGIMALAGTAVGAVGLAGRKVLPVWRGVGNDRRAVPGQGEVLRVNQPEFHGGEDGEQGEDFLQGGFWVVRGGLAAQDVVHDGSRGAGLAGILDELPVGTDDLVRLFAVLAVLPGGEEAVAGVAFPRGEPEAVHEVVIRAERGKPAGGFEAAKNRQGNVVRKDFANPRGEAGPGLCLVEKQDEEDERAKDLRLVFGGPSPGGIMVGEVVLDKVEVKAHQLLSLLAVKVEVVTRVVS